MYIYTHTNREWRQRQGHLGGIETETDGQCTGTRLQPPMFLLCRQTVIRPFFLIPLYIHSLLFLFAPSYVRNNIFVMYYSFVWWARHSFMIPKEQTSFSSYSDFMFNIFGNSHWRMQIGSASEVFLLFVFSRAELKCQPAKTTLIGPRRKWKTCLNNLY